MQFSRQTDIMIEKELRKLKPANIEVRLIGLQNGDNPLRLNETVDFIKKMKLPVFEADLFGGDTRHICIDIKTGVSFDVLISNRLYKPGELTNKVTREQFERASLEPNVQAPDA